MTEVSDPRKTEERLRSWLNSNQPKREQMCVAVLPTLGPFSDCKARRPQGGPDGGRDIEALYENSIKVWAAVGFKNDASRSREHRQWAEKKFKDDLDSALVENPELAGFVFLTNVDLTPSVKDSLKRHATAKGLRFVEIYDLEVLRHHLDSVDGLIARVQYLDLPMTPTEQAALVNRYGSQLQGAIAQGFDSMARTLQRIEFLVECQLPVREVYLGLEVDTLLTKHDFPDAAVMLRINPKYSQNLFACLCRVDSGRQSRQSLSTVSLLWSSAEVSKLLQSGRALFGSASRSFSGTFNFRIHQGLVPMPLGDFISGTMMIYCTPCLRDYATYLKLAINRYVVLDGPAPAPSESVYLPGGLEWPDGTPQELAEVKWVSLSRRLYSIDVSRDTLAKKR